MKKFKMKKLIMGSLCFLSCISFVGCVDIGPMQEKASSAEEAAANFLTDLQTGDFEAAMAYMEEGNELLHVLPAATGESIPELDNVYQKFCEQLKDMTFTISDEDTGLPNTLYVTVKTRDYDSAIRTAMADALKKQSEEGGKSFSDISSWMGQAVENAKMGEEDTYNVTMSAKNGGYYLQHTGYPDQSFLNLITGGFYEYADLTMTTCTMEDSDGIKYTYYIGAVGDTVIAYIMETTSPYDEAYITEDDLNQMRDYCAETSAAFNGVYMGVWIDNNEVTVSTGIDFYEADQSTMIEAGIVSGRYSGNTTTSYLSLSSTINSFESDGMVCTTVPQYDAVEK